MMAIHSRKQGNKIMAKLTKKQRADLERTLTSAKKVQGFILNDKVVVCTKDFKGKPYRSSHFYNEDENLCISPIMKEYGSLLAQLPDVITGLEKFLADN